MDINEEVAHALSCEDENCVVRKFLYSRMQIAIITHLVQHPEKVLDYLAAHSDFMEAFVLGE